MIRAFRKGQTSLFYHGHVELEDWNNYQAEKYDYSFELGKQTINEYFSKTFKRTETIIKKYQDFFINLSKISPSHFSTSSGYNNGLPKYS